MKFICKLAGVVFLSGISFAQSITFSQHQATANAWPQAEADLNGDGVSDIISPGTQDPSNPLSTAGFWVNLSNGDGTLQASGLPRGPFWSQLTEGGARRLQQRR